MVSVMVAASTSGAEKTSALGASMAAGPALVKSRAVPSAGAGKRAVACADKRPAAATAEEAAVSTKRQRFAGGCPITVPRPLRRRRTGDEDAAEFSLSDLQTIVINLARRPDRMDGCAARLRERCVGLPFDRFVATDGKATPIGEDEVTNSWHTARNVGYQKQRAIRKGWDDLDTYKERHLALSPGERGCASSHIRAWQKCLELAGDSERPLLVLEDDAAPTAEFTKILGRAMRSLPKDAGLLYLGYSQAADWRREISPELVESEYVWTTVAYIVWPACARQMLSQLPINEPVDNWMAGLGASGQLKAYCVRPKIVLQADAWNINSDVAHSDEHYWGPNSDIAHSDALYWGPEHPEARGLLATRGSGLSALLGDDPDASDSDEETEEDMHL